MFSITTRASHRWSLSAQTIRTLQIDVSLMLGFDRFSIFSSDRNVLWRCYHDESRSRAPASLGAYDPKLRPASPLVKYPSRTKHSLTRTNADRTASLKDVCTTSTALQSNTSVQTVRREPTKKQESWRIQKTALRKKFQDGWAPPKRLSPDAIEGVRELHKQDPQKFSTPVLAEQFKVSPEAIRRILKSKWRPSQKEAEERKMRWERRKVRIWNHMAELGLRPRKAEFASFSDAEKLKHQSGRSGNPTSLS
ncbi:Required for respiratory growth protein 9 mitochondrial [Emydomyces testavorans]|uniref:Required for respiratory growth protein 9, mitochondrial n=1 Tax=Emydomyces testavorans TaxID=2070801 RepID=A0AAF0DFC7_9EURO|nr:Required for respiratory growth protein 9 mitochondrial [Emydomyces testavorans]